MKIFRKGDASRAVDMSEEITKEVSIMKECDSAWVVKSLGLKLPADPDDHAIIVMEFMSSGSIEKCVNALTAHQKVMAILSAILGLAATHAKGVIHGDIKPSNLLVDGDFHAKLSDFGAALAPDGTTTVSIPISTAYAGPEVLDGAKPTVSADIYGLGHLICYLVTGKHTFDPAMPPVRMIRSVLAGAKVELPGVKPELVQLVQAMVAVNPEERPASAVAVFDAVCEHGFQFFEGIDPVAVRLELAKFGVADKFETKVAKLERENATLKADLELARRLFTPDMELEFRAEKGDAEAQLKLGEKLLESDPGKAKALLRKCRLPKAAQLLTVPVPGLFKDLLATPYVKALKESLPWMKSTK
jgi:serine/threonine protein kinase